MKNTYVLLGLREKRAEMSGDLIKTERVIAKLQADLAVLDAAMHIFDPSIKPGSIKPKLTLSAPTLFKHGEFSRTVLTVMRQQVRPMTIREIAIQLAADHQIDVTGQFGLESLMRKVRVVLVKQKPETVTRETMPDLAHAWSVAG